MSQCIGLIFSLYVGHRVMVAHDLQADDEKVQKRVARKLARQQVYGSIIHSHNLEQTPLKFWFENWEIGRNVFALVVIWWKYTYRYIGLNFPVKECYFGTDGLNCTVEMNLFYFVLYFLFMGFITINSLIIIILVGPSANITSEKSWLIFASSSIWKGCIFNSRDQVKRWKRQMICCLGSHIFCS